MIKVKLCMVICLYLSDVNAIRFKQVLPHILRENYDCILFKSLESKEEKYGKLKNAFLDEITNASHYSFNIPVVSLDTNQKVRHKRILYYHEDIFNVSTSSLVGNTTHLIVLNKVNLGSAREALGKQQLRLDSRVFLIAPNERLYTAFKVSKDSEIIFDQCHNLDCGLKDRRNLYGHTLVAIYDEWKPFCIVLSKLEPPVGLLPELVNALAVDLNFTVRY